MFDHIGIAVADVPASRAFYVAALAPLGVGVAMEFGDQRRPRARRAGRNSGSARASRPPAPPSGLRARETATRCDAFHAAALKAGRQGQRRAGLAPRTTIRTITGRLQSTSTDTI